MATRRPIYELDWLLYWYFLSPSIAIVWILSYFFMKLVCVHKKKKKKWRVKRQTRVRRSRGPWLIYTEYHLTCIPFFSLEYTFCTCTYKVIWRWRQMTRAIVVVRCDRVRERVRIYHFEYTWKSFGNVSKTHVLL